MNNVDNKTFLITGAAAGIGSNLAQKIDSMGGRLILVDINKIDLDGFRQKPTFFQLDLTNEAQLQALCHEIKRFRHDCLINNAGISNYGAITSISQAQWDATLRLNLDTPWKLIKASIAQLEKSELGLVLNIGSVCGVNVKPNRTAYCASKFGLRGLSLTLSAEFIDKKPSFCLLTLGSTTTDFGDLTAAQKAALHEKGEKKYLTADNVVNKIITIINTPSAERQTEYTYE